MSEMHAVPGRRYARLVILSCALVFACVDRPTAPAPRGGDPDFVARTLAAALGDDGARLSVRDAMRLSPLDGHKLVLHTFLQTKEGNTLLREASRRASMTPIQFLAEVTKLGPLDFYMPVRSHRRTWEGDANVALIMYREGTLDQSIPAFTPDGRTLQASRRTPEGLPPFFYLEPSEYKGRRVDAQPAAPGKVIEDANDGHGSAVFVFRSPNGDSTVYDLSTMTPKERVAFTGGPDTTKVGYFEHYVCDNGACWSDAEFRFNTTWKSASGAVLGSGQYYVASLHPDEPDPYLLNAPLIFARMMETTAETMFIHIIEEDRDDPFGTNPDDNCGAVTINVNQNGLWHNYPDQSDCYGGVGYGYFVNVALTAEYLWTPKPYQPPPPPTYYVQIIGPTSAEPGNFCNWYVSTNVSNPSYQWYQNGTPISNNPEIVLAVDQSFDLDVQVWNATQNYGHSIHVDVQSGNGQCAFSMRK